MSSTGVRESRNDRIRSIEGLIRNEEQFIQSLRVVSNISTLSGLGVTGQSDSNSGTVAGSGLRKSGDLKLGSFGNNFDIVNIIDGKFGVIPNTVPDENNSSAPMLVLNPENGLPDELDTITQGVDVLSFQELYLRTTNEVITFTQNGNIITQIGGDFAVPPDTLLFLLYDTILQKWNIIGTSIGSGEDVSLWADFPAVSDVDVNDKDILKVKNLDFDDPFSTIEGLVNLNFFQTAQEIDSLSDQLFYQVAAAQKHHFAVAGATVFEILQASIEVHQPINLLGNALVLDVDKDTQINAFNDDQIQFITNSLLRMSITDTAIFPAVDVSMINGNKITNLVNPTNPQDVATKDYADSLNSISAGDSKIQIIDTGVGVASIVLDNDTKIIIDSIEALLQMLTL